MTFHQHGAGEPRELDSLFGNDLTDILAGRGVEGMHFEPNAGQGVHIWRFHFVPSRNNHVTAIVREAHVRIGEKWVELPRARGAITVTIPQTPAPTGRTSGYSRAKPSIQSRNVG